MSRKIVYQVGYFEKDSDYGSDDTRTFTDLGKAMKYYEKLVEDTKDELLDAVWLDCAREEDVAEGLWLTLLTYGRPNGTYLLQDMQGDTLDEAMDRLIDLYWYTAR